MSELYSAVTARNPPNVETYCGIADVVVMTGKSDLSNQRPLAKLQLAMQDHVPPVTNGDILRGAEGAPTTPPGDLLAQKVLDQLSSAHGVQQYRQEASLANAIAWVQRAPFSHAMDLIQLWMANYPQKRANERAGAAALGLPVESALRELGLTLIGEGSDVRVRHPRDCGTFALIEQPAARRLASVGWDDCAITLAEGQERLERGNYAGALTSASCALEQALDHRGFHEQTAGRRISAARAGGLFAGAGTRFGAAAEDVMHGVHAMRSRQGDAHAGTGATPADAWATFRLAVTVVIWLEETQGA